MSKVTITIYAPANSTSMENVTEFLGDLLGMAVSFSVSYNRNPALDTTKRRVDNIVAAGLDKALAETKAQAKRDSAAHARAALAKKRAASKGPITQPIPPKRRKTKSKRRKGGLWHGKDERLVYDVVARRIDVDFTLANMGLTRASLLKRKAHHGSIEHSLKQAIGRQEHEAKRKAAKAQGDANTGVAYL